MASQWLQKARSTPPIYAFFLPTGKACPQTLKLTMFPIKTFSPTAGFHNLEHQISIGGIPWRLSWDSPQFDPFSHLIISNCNLRGKDCLASSVMASQEFSCNTNSSSFSFVRGSHEPSSTKDLKKSPNRSTSMADAALSISNFKFLGEILLVTAELRTANWKTRAAQSAVTATSARHRASAPSPKRSPGGSP